MRKHYFDETLTRIPLFDGLDANDLDAVTSASTKLHLDAGTTLMREGTFAYDVFVVIDGTLEVTRDGEHVAHIGPGGLAGEMGILADKPRNSTVTAATDVEVLEIDRRSFAGLLNAVPELAANILPVVAERTGLAATR
jgi:CRP-like cAMP-binding protein